jgi:hypothetical protein
MIRKFKVLIGFCAFSDLPTVLEGSVLRIDTDKVHESYINYWVNMGYLKEIKPIEGK